MGVVGIDWWVDGYMETKSSERQLIPRINDQNIFTKESSATSVTITHGEIENIINEPVSLKFTEEPSSTHVPTSHGDIENVIDEPVSIKRKMEKCKTHDDPNYWHFQNTYYVSNEVRITYISPSQQQVFIRQTLFSNDPVITLFIMIILNLCLFIHTGGFATYNLTFTTGIYIGTFFLSV